MASRKSSGRVAGGVAAGLVPTAIAALNMALPPHAHAPASVSCGQHCGTERWPVKTMSDRAAAGVNLSPKTASVHELVAMSAPDTAPTSDDQRFGGPEKQEYSVTATLYGYKVEGGATGDQDFHIVIQDPGTKETMIVEIPDPNCSGACNSVQGEAIARARQQFLAAFPADPPAAKFAVVDDPKPEVTVKGVGLFDFYHGQTGVATNCLELHPVLEITFPGSGTFKSSIKATPELKTEAGEHTCVPRAE